MVEVIQADRDAAADHLQSITDDGHTYDAIRRGQCDNHPLVQAFAAHRIAAEKAVLDRLPDRPDADLIEILGRPCFACINLAMQLRHGGWEIGNRAEDEQAAVLLFTLKHWMVDKTNWRENADRELQEIADAIGADHGQ